jgi:hypothetical protein
MSTELERGDILFVYRLRVGIREVSSLEDVQGFFFLLHPDGAARLREMIVPAKRLPDVQTPQSAWAFVARVADSAGYFHQELQQRTYQTKTHGERAQPATRAAGEGRYAIVDHDGHGHFAYALELPPEPGDAQPRAGHRIRGELHRGGEESRYACAPGHDFNIELDTEEEQIHDTDLFQALRVGPGELSMEPLRSGRLI